MISPSQRPLPENTQYSQHTNIQALGGIRTHDRSRRAAVDLRLSPRGHWDRLYIYIFIHSFIHSVFCLTTSPKPPPKRCLHIVRSRASSFKWEYPRLSLRSSSSFLRLLPRLLATSMSPFIFPSITCFRRQFLRKMWQIQLAFRFLISCRIFLCSLTLTLLHFSHDRSNWSSPSFSSTTFHNFPGISDLLSEASKFQHHTKPCSKCSILLVYIYIYIYIYIRRSQWPRCVRRRFAATRLLGLRIRIPPGAWMFVSVSVVCCQGEVSESCRSLVQKSPTECDVSECDRETSNMRRLRPTMATKSRRKLYRYRRPQQFNTSDAKMALYFLMFKYYRIWFYRFVNNKRCSEESYILYLNKQCQTNQLTNEMNPCSGILLEELTITQSVKKFPFL